MLTYTFQASAVVTQQLSMLSNPSKLDIDSCGNDPWYNKLGDDFVELAVDWLLLPNMQKLWMQNGTYKFDERMIGLSQLQSLRFLQVRNVVCRDSLTVNCLVRLVCSLKMNCPNVQVAMGESEAYLVA